MIRKIITSVILLIVVTLTGCTENGPLDVLSKETDISFSAGKIVSDYDSHGGFHGDGTRLTTVVFPDNSVAAEIIDSDKWKPFPLPEVLQIAIYGADGHGPYELFEYRIAE